MQHLVFSALALALFAACSAPPARTERSPADVANTASLRKYLDDFDWPGNTPSWYPFIESVEVQGSLVRVRTSIINVGQSRERARNLCSVVSGFVFSNPNQSLKLNRIQVFDQGGRILSDRDGLRDDC